jgi:hypothetical protein
MGIPEERSKIPRSLDLILGSTMRTGNGILAIIWIDQLSRFGACHVQKGSNSDCSPFFLLHLVIYYIIVI